AENMVKLREEALKGGNDIKLINELMSNLEDILVNKYCMKYPYILSLYKVIFYLIYFLIYIVESDLDKDNKYFGIVELKDKIGLSNPVETDNNIILPTPPLFYYFELDIKKDNMFFFNEYRWGFTKKPKLIFIYWPLLDSFKENIRKHLKIYL
ncbi:hypothetical protein M153_4180001, partial [Pseudoloma neurophilia]